VCTHTSSIPTTHRARQILGAGPLLLPEQPAVLETDAGRAREIARAHLGYYIKVTNYAKNLRRLGFVDDDFADGGSDRLVDSIVAWGDDAAIAARVREHFDAGADHVCVQVLTPSRSEAPREQWRALAPALVAH
jgi:probable F420-dependent oxidoreductase